MRLLGDMRLTLSLAENSQIRLEHRASSRLVQGRQGCGCCAATERATPTIAISAKGCSRCSSNAAQRECNYTNRLMGYY